MEASLCGYRQHCRLFALLFELSRPSILSPFRATPAALAGQGKLRGLHHSAAHSPPGSAPGGAASHATQRTGCHPGWGRVGRLVAAAAAAAAAVVFAAAAAAAAAVVVVAAAAAAAVVAALGVASGCARVYLVEEQDVGGGPERVSPGCCCGAGLCLGWLVGCWVADPQNLAGCWGANLRYLTGCWVANSHLAGCWVADLCLEPSLQSFCRVGLVAAQFAAAGAALLVGVSSALHQGSGNAGAACVGVAAG
ncbi:hypothetical protein DUNSADRAFT_986 [Dunaliella salina]|uniref:Uncharacterized protein n=1 Tax=Dunaliella salina TaxID=3046 RepID=A0ABQ7FY53_DUNSA|nr:hypothetical protein DUNSADRAFT_986 [Dunaliella salina]|eukprot:KAF5827293.1 hypothetical protein DUNSADRAFT_986 [Dunaliella salina]